MSTVSPLEANTYFFTIKLGLSEEIDSDARAPSFGSNLESDEGEESIDDISVHREGVRNDHSIQSGFVQSESCFVEDVTIKEAIQRKQVKEGKRRLMSNLI